MITTDPPPEWVWGWAWIAVRMKAEMRFPIPPVNPYTKMNWGVPYQLSTRVPSKLEREQVEDDMDDAIVYKCAGDDPPILSECQILERQVAELMAVGDAQDQEPPPRRRNRLSRMWR